MLGHDQAFKELYREIWRLRTEKTCVLRVVVKEKQGHLYFLCESRRPPPLCMGPPIIADFPDTLFPFWDSLNQKFREHYTHYSYWEELRLRAKASAVIFRHPEQNGLLLTGLSGNLFWRKSSGPWKTTWGSAGVLRGIEAQHFCRKLIQKRDGCLTKQMGPLESDLVRKKLELKITNSVLGVLSLPMN